MRQKLDFCSVAMFTILNWLVCADVHAICYYILANIIDANSCNSEQMFAYELS